MIRSLEAVWVAIGPWSNEWKSRGLAEVIPDINGLAVMEVCFDNSALPDFVVAPFREVLKLADERVYERENDWWAVKKVLGIDGLRNKFPVVIDNSKG